MAEWSIIVGSPNQSTGAITVSLPGGWAENDILVLTTESAAGETVSTPTGYTQHASSPVVGTGTQLGIFWKRATASESSVSVADPGNHVWGRLTAIRGAVTTGDPFEASATGTASSGTTISLPSVTPSGNGRFILQLASYARDRNMSPSSGTYGANIEEVNRGYGGAGTTSGNGGGCFYMYGVADDTTTVSGASMEAPSDTQGQAMMSLALTPVTASDVIVASERLGVVVSYAPNTIQVASQRLGVVLTTDESTAIQVASLRLGVVVDTSGPPPPSGSVKGSLSILW